jgi:two-component system sensor histidine kinase ChiS
MAVKILVVDNDPASEQMIRQHFNRQIRQQQFVFEFVASGTEAMMHVRTDPDVDIVLCEVCLTDMDGLSLPMHLMRINPSVKTVMISECASMKDIRMAMNRGAFDFITKPIDFADLEATINRVIRHVLQLRESENTIKIHREHIEQIAAASARFVPREFLRVLGKESILDVKLGDQIQREMTIMFSDIRDFTTLSERMTPQENFNFLNSYLSRVSPIIREYNGFIDKYLGDGIMALFPGREFPGQTDDAINAAIALQRAVVVYNDHRANCGYRPIHIGIGLHTGSVMLGTVGENERMEGTVVSDAVNLASRIEGLTEMYGASVVVSDRTLLSLSHPFLYHLRFLDRVQVKGKQKAVSVFELLDDTIPDIQEGKLRTLEDFETGLFHYYRSEFDEATNYFKHVLAIDPTDKAAQFYLQRSISFLESGPPLGWRGVEVLTEK